MKSIRILVALAATCLVSAASAADGLVATKSPMPVKATADKFEELAKQRGLTVFGRIDHAAGAAKVGKSLRPTELLIFGSPQAGTPFMECSQTVGIDLPLKALVCENEPGQVRVLFTSAATLIERFSLPPRFQDNLAAAERLIAEVLASADPAGTAPAPR